MYPWKIQKVVVAPTCDYSDLRRPLPNPPKGTKWHQDKTTKEYRLIQEEEQFDTTVVKLPSSSVVVADHDDDDDVGKKKIEEEGRSNNNDCQEEAVVMVPMAVAEAISSSDGENQWEILFSETPVAVSVPSCESRTVAAASGQHHDEQPGQQQRQKTVIVERILSNSTVESNEEAVPAAPVLGVDYLEHVVLLTDTFQGICLAYRITSTKLRQANRFSGSSLLLAPKKLLIPINKKAFRDGYIRAQNIDSEHYKILSLQADLPHLTSSEAKAYLKLADWNLEDAIQSAKEDGKWEEQEKIKAKKKRVAEKARTGRCMSSSSSASTLSWSSSSSSQPLSPNKNDDNNNKFSLKTFTTAATKATRPIVFEAIPAFVSKSITPPQKPQQDIAGVEMQPIRKQKSSFTLPWCSPPRYWP